MIIAIVYGLDAPEDGNGLADYAKVFAEKIPGVKVKTFQQDDEGVSSWVLSQISTPGEKIVLIGHSFGFDRCMQVVKVLNNKGFRVAYLAAIDGVVKNWWIPIVGWFFPILNWTIPQNVDRCDSLQRKWSWTIPPSSPIRNENMVFVNWNQVDCSHADMPKNIIAKTRIVMTTVALGTPEGESSR